MYQALVAPSRNERPAGSCPEVLDKNLLVGIQTRVWINKQGLRMPGLLDGDERRGLPSVPSAKR